ncbi:MAG: 4-(cytidine 5'-diphospho)-2-C-methyl-D-erythritol kinase [Hyphomicrobiaceae bacterium]|nr:MAG: 4-(cytidine 5'-diphospho)-2-C-methyl-D-erythritol kinase [Hyphomicrobiaceae bacterium]
MQIGEKARAKVNLTLSVLGRRPDGYHELESLVTFADIADRIVLRPGEDLSVHVTGPFAGAIAGPNLLERTLRLLRDLDAGLQLGSVELEKNLPVAAGLGGGSADAAALLRAVRRANPAAGNIPWHEIATQLGADVPVCLADRPALIWGIGEEIEPLNGLPGLAAVLVNPCQPLATGPVFRALQAGPAPATRQRPPPAGPFPDMASLLGFMGARGNALERPATTLLPVIGDVKQALASLPECRYAALSGSGPTCFGIFSSSGAAARAAQVLAGRYIEWWIAATRLAGGAQGDVNSLG